MDKPKYTKLSELVGDQFTIERAYGYQWKMWDTVSKRMLISETYEQGYRKIYSLDTDKGKLDLGSGQLSSLLEAVYKNGAADINGKTFSVKSNGKSGMDIRYYFNLVKDAPVRDTVVEDITDDINLDDIPF